MKKPGADVRRRTSVRACNLGRPAGSGDSTIEQGDQGGSGGQRVNREIREAR
jgi:hypothetical protein